jgi:hypothetical protein
MNSESMDFPIDFENESKHDTCSILEVMSTTSSESHGSSSGTKHRGADQEEKKLRANIIQGGETTVQWARVTVIAVVVAFAVAVSATIYVFASRGDQQNFELQVRR